MKNHFARFLIIITIVLLMLAAAYAYSTYFRFPIDETAYLTPIPWETVGAYENIYPIDSRFDAVIAARRRISSSRRQSEGIPKVIFAERLNYAEAKGKILPPNASDRDHDVKDSRVWFVVFEGRWSVVGGPLPPMPTQTSTLISTVLPTPTPTLTPTPSPACIFVLFFGPEPGDGMELSGIKDCEQWKANQNIDTGE